VFQVFWIDSKGWFMFRITTGHNVQSVLSRTGKKWDDGKPEKSSSAIPSLKKRTIVVHLFLHRMQKQMNNKYPLFLKTFLN
jgi:hypothetical protein